MLKNLLPVRVFVSLGVVLIVGISLLSSGAKAYDTASVPCGYVAGLSTYATPGVVDSGRVDYGRADWSIDLANINSAPSTRGLGIAVTNQLCFDPNGDPYMDNGWVWNNNFGWIDFGWCASSGIPGCTAYAPTIDFSTPNAYGAPWRGKVWNDSIGWIDFDWCATSSTLSGCEVYEMHTTLPTVWPTTSTTAIGQVRGSAWNDKIGWIQFGDNGGAVAQQLPDGVSLNLIVQPVVTITPDPALATKFGGTTGVIAPKADAEDSYTIHVDFEILDGLGNPTGTYLDPTDYDVEMAVTTSPGSNFGSIKTTDGAPGVDAVFWDDTFGDPQGTGFDWAISSFAPTSNLNGLENAQGIITKYFDMDAANNELPARDYYVIQDFDFTITPIAQVDPATISPTWSLGTTWDLKFRPLMEVTNLAYSPLSSDPYLFNFFPANEDEDLYIRGLVVNWDTSPTVLTSSASYNLTGIFSANSFYTDGFTVWNGLSTATSPSGGTGLKFMYSTDMNLLFSPYPAASVPHDSFISDPASVALLTSKLMANPAYQFVPSLPSNTQSINRFGIAPSSAVNAEIVRLVASDLVGLTLDEAMYRSEIVYRINDPLDPTRDILVAYYSNRITSSPPSAAVSQIPYYPALDLGVDPVLDTNGDQISDTNGAPAFNEYPDTDPAGLGTWGSLDGGEWVPGMGLLQDAVILGSVTGTSALQTVSSTDDIVLIGNLTTYRVRNALFQRLSKLKKGASVDSGSASLTSDLERPQNVSSGVSLLGGSLLYFTGGDVILPEEVTSGYDQKTIVVEGGDIYIQGDLDGSNAVGLVAFQNYFQVGGNIYILPNVKELHKVTMYADGSVMSTDQFPPTGAGGNPTWLYISSRQAALKTQLYISGSLITKNTIGGVRGVGDFSDGYLPTGLPAQTTFEAAKYDLNHLREFQVCWYMVDANTLEPIDFDNDGSTIVNGEPDPDDLVDCPGYTRSPALDTTGVPLGNNNEPVRIEYIPPPSSLPLLGEMQGGGFNLF